MKNINIKKNCEIKVAGVLTKFKKGNVESVSEATAITLVQHGFGTFANSDDRETITIPKKRELVAKNPKITSNSSNEFKELTNSLKSYAKRVEATEAKIEAILAKLNSEEASE